MSNKENFFDVRVYQRYVKEGEISREEYKKHIESLPDVSNKSQPLEIIEEEDEQEEEE